jgi:hypothetical protein
LVLLLLGHILGQYILLLVQESLVQESLVLE